MAGALRGTACLEKLEAAGFESARVLRPTGYTTSRYTAAFLVSARKGVRATPAA